MIAATYGRGIYRYHFGDDTGRCPEPPAGGGSGPGGGGSGGGGGGNGNGPGGTAGCSFGTGLKSVTARSAGLGLRLGFTRQLRKPVDVDVLQVSQGRRAFGERLIARFRSRTTGVRWNGQRTKGHRKPTDGIYVVRYTMHVARGVDDVRRVAFIRTKGRYRGRPPMLHRTPCQLLRRAELSLPVFGGIGNRRLFVSVLTLRTAKVTITLRARGRTLRTVNVLARRGVKTLVRFGAGGVPRADVQVNVLARDGRGRGAARLTARRL
jgi:hypothetical protein